MPLRLSQWRQRDVSDLHKRRNQRDGYRGALRSRGLPQLRECAAQIRDLRGLKSPAIGQRGHKPVRGQSDTDVWAKRGPPHSTWLHT